MSLKVRFKCDAKCRQHPNYDPESKGQTFNGCDTCDALYGIWLYTSIAARKASKVLGAQVDFHGKGRVKEAEKSTDG